MRVGKLKWQNCQAIIRKEQCVKIDTIKSNTKMYRIYKGHKKGIWSSA